LISGSRIRSLGSSAILVGGHYNYKHEEIAQFAGGATTLFPRAHRMDKVFEGRQRPQSLESKSPVAMKSQFARGHFFRLSLLKEIIANSNSKSYIARARNSLTSRCNMAIAEQGLYWRRNLARLVASKHKHALVGDNLIPETLQFRDN
jgi:hypothetical protein